jgi:hypothetical protein
MKNYELREVQQKELISITCDCCKTVYSDIMEMQEFLHYANDAGYGSIMGDGNRLRLDLCQHCTKKLLGDYIRVAGNYINGGLPQEVPLYQANDFFSEISSFKDDKPE